MKIVVLSLLLVSSVGFAQTPDSGGVTGKWKLHQSIAGNESDSDCAFTQKDNDLTGSCGTEEKSIKITGKVDGKKVSWSYNADYNGTPLTLKFSGTLDSGKITGEVEVDPFSATGDFTATQVK